MNIYFTVTIETVSQLLMFKEYLNDIVELKNKLAKINPDIIINVEVKIS